MDVARRLSAPLELLGHRLPAGTTVMPAIYLVHFDNRNHNSPEAFNPERFANGFDGTTWLPFGGGRRRCLGAALAMMELRIVLAHVLQRRQPEPVDPRPERPRLRGITFVPDKDAHLYMRPTARAEPDLRPTEPPYTGPAPTASPAPGSPPTPAA